MAAVDPDDKHHLPTVDPASMLSTIKWHIERYDRLRTSATSRAAVVLSAAALLSAGNAIVLTQIFSTTVGWMRSWWLLVFSALAVFSATLVIVALLRAANVLLTTRGSRAIFANAGQPPIGPVFNGSDTVAHFKTFASFQRVLLDQDGQQAVEAASVELWICIKQHRHRYTQLRQAVGSMRYAALAFLLLLASALTVNAVHNF